MPEDMYECCQKLLCPLNRAEDFYKLVEELSPEAIVTDYYEGQFVNGNCEKSGGTDPKRNRDQCLDENLTDQSLKSQ
ncbi:hypothetical protein HNY73_002478 [Argiope bruennichi]|uniref:Uncharacterized protein n=1 Tax=Argiope bruennichi TaxID=94029 RepID=A0A8T0G023_ARGBR|nr:hypothetical protein HNY73_002478 [Argiope bruennichi]